MRETWVRSLACKDPLENGTATHSSTLVWRIPWTEEPGRLQSMGSQRIGHGWATFPFTFFSIHSTEWVLLDPCTYTYPFLICNSPTWCLSASWVFYCPLIQLLLLVLLFLLLWCSLCCVTGTLSNGAFKIVWMDIQWLSSRVTWMWKHLTSNLTAQSLFLLLFRFLVLFSLLLLFIYFNWRLITL